MVEDFGERWLLQAEDDYEWGVDSLKMGHFPQACFVAQQVAEKALKAIAYKRGAKVIKSHSILELVTSLKINGSLLSAAKLLDQYYITPRYPDSLPSGIPADFFSKDQAEDALKLSKLFLEAATRELGK